MFTLTPVQKHTTRRPNFLSDFILSLNLIILIYVLRPLPVKGGFSFLKFLCKVYKTFHFEKISKQIAVHCASISQATLAYKDETGVN